MAIKSQKFLPQGGNGGSLAVRPKTNLVPIKKQSSSLAKVGGKQEDPMLVIKTKVIKIEDLLKGTLAAEKKAADEKRKQQEEENRSKQEEEVEKTPKSKEKGIKIPVPGKIKSFWDNIKKFIGTVIFGWLALKLLPLLPKLMPIVKFLASTADFLINIGGTILKGLVTFVDWGYKAVESTEKWIGDKFGEDAADKFNTFTKYLTKTMNLVMALGIAAASMAGNPFKKKKKVKPRKKPKWQKKLQQKWKKSKLGKRVRNLQAFKKKTTRRISQAVKPKNILKNLKKSKIGSRISNVGQRATKALDSLKNLKPKNIGQSKWFKNIRTNLGTGAGKLWQGTKNIASKTGDITIKVVKSINKSFSSLGKQLGGALTDAYNNSAKWVQKRFDNVVEISKSLKSKWDNALGAAGDAFNKMKKGAQEAVMKKVLEPVMEFLQPLIKKMKGLKGTIMKTLQNIPGYDQIAKVLQKFGGEGSQGLMKKLGGKAIPIIGGIVNMGFAYDRLSKGDSIGGLIEGTSGILDLIGLIPGGQFGPPISMLMDGYMFARDFVPQIQEGEEKAVNALGLSGFKKNIDNIFSKLPGIGEIAKMITGGDEKDETGGETEKGFKHVTKTDLTGKMGLGGPVGETFGGKGGSTYDDNSNNIVSTNNSLSNKINGVSSSASYEEDTGKEVVIINPKNNPSKTSSSTEKGKVVTIDTGTGGSGSDSTASLYRG